VIAMVSNGRFLIDESKYPSLAQIRLSPQDYDRHKAEFENNLASVVNPHDIFKKTVTAAPMEVNVPSYSSPNVSGPSSSSSTTTTSSSSSSYFSYSSSTSTSTSTSIPASSSSSTTSASSPSLAWKIALGGGLTHTITKPVPSTSSLQHLFSEPGTFYPRIRLYFIIRKIIRWLNDPSRQESTRPQTCLPKLNTLMGYSISRRQLHEAIIEWFETLEFQWKLVPDLEDWVKLSQFHHSQINLTKDFKYTPTTLTMFMWAAFSLIHGKSNDDEIYSISLAKQTSTSISTLFSRMTSPPLSTSPTSTSPLTTSPPLSTTTTATPTSPLGMTHPELLSHPIFIGTSDAWSVLSFRSMVRLIADLCLYGDHPGIYGLTVPYCLYTVMISLIREEIIHYDGHDIEQQYSHQHHQQYSHQQQQRNREFFQYVQLEQKSKICLVHGITLEEILHGVQYQFIPFVSEIANVYHVGSKWIILMNEFIEKLKQIH